MSRLLRMLSLLGMAAMLTACATANNELKLFTTDGCSVFPDGTSAHRSLWIRCCIQHDLRYWQGGSYADRLKADKELEQCVAAVGEEEIAKIMLAGVRIGGTPWLPTSFRWGYGWPWLRGYEKLSKAEKEQIKTRLNEFRQLLQQLFSEVETTLDKGE